MILVAPEAKNSEIPNEGAVMPHLLILVMPSSDDKQSQDHYLSNN